MDQAIIALGLCLGASTVSMVKIRQASPLPGASTGAEIVDHRSEPHDGDPRGTLSRMLATIDWPGIDKICVTGRKFRHMLNLTTIAEPEAVELAYRLVRPDDRHCRAIISAGGETFMVYVLDSAGKITNVLTGNKCAAGTGEFFLQQLRRMDVDLEKAALWADETDPYQVSGRCSVFCKSDCTHATNKGIPKSRVTAGLGIMMANKILELLKNVERRDLMLVGGTARNRMMVRYLSQSIPGLIVPEEAPYFEALGAALWSIEHPTAPFPGLGHLFTEQQTHFDTLPPLRDFNDKVTFKSLITDRIKPGDTCLLGLDVGSTTTKAVLLRRADQALLASIYLRTSGDPVGAARRCYQALWEQIEPHVTADQIEIIGLGVCGSGRQIAGLHALTLGVINEIIAHAAAAVYFDAQVDTIFEIGGQDAKYTYINNGVPCDYAMNEACSAGTGSFLEESALETLRIPMTQIAEIALEGDRPPNFNDQCAAFISSDIKNAIHDGLARQDITAGLVYSICMNYNNRVKGNRPVGQKVFMQGGVCYNRAVPLAMAALTGKPIVVPPEPGLMGAFGAALEVDRRIRAGLMAAERFDLQTLALREVSYGKSFICKGGAEKCDRRCSIARIIVNETTYPFGGACNRYENLRRNKRVDSSALDLVRMRQELIFNTYAPALLDPRSPGYRGRVGINRSFLVNSYYPLYAHFFAALGYQPILPAQYDPAGIDQCRAPFCYPAELAHGFFHHLIHLEEPPELIFLPHFKSLPLLDGDRNSQVCPLVQGETYYLQSTFRTQLKELQRRGTQVVSPLLHLTQGLAAARQALVQAVLEIGISRPEAEKAFSHAVDQMQRCQEHMFRLGRQALERLGQDPQQMGVVLFGRPYNSLVPEAHKGIPHKFASRGVMLIPLDFIDCGDQASKKGMYWGMGQRIVMTAHKIKDHPQLFGTYITNFSCGPDSFVIGYFRDIMGRKPSLTLELDSHTADAGLETRIEAFLDIVQAYRRLHHESRVTATPAAFQPARITVDKGRLTVIDSNGQSVQHGDPRVALVFPSMGDIGTRALSAVFKSHGFRSHAHRPSDEAILKLGRGNTSCKECLPLILTTGTLLDYIRHDRQPDEVTLYFMPTGSGPCRFGQYRHFMEDLVARQRIENVALFSLSSDDGYGGLPARVHRRAWWAVVVSDTLEDMRAMLLANAADPATAMPIFQNGVDRILAALESGSWHTLAQAMEHHADRMRALPLKRPVEEVPLISLTGEIFVRRDGLSRQHLTEQLAGRGFATLCAPVAEWVYYSDYIVDKGFSCFQHAGWRDRLTATLKHHVMRLDERRIKQRLAASGLVHPHTVSIPEVVATARPYISPDLTGEAVLTVGASLREVVSLSCGVIAIGPFGCMPNRLSEALLSEAMRRENKLAAMPQQTDLSGILSDINDLPFLAIESDGSPFPQLLQAKLEAFCLRATRLHQVMRPAR